MAVSWNRPDADAEPSDPDQPGNPTVIALSFDPATGYITVRLARSVAPFAAPEGVQPDDVIEPTSVFKPWIPYSKWEDADEDLHAR